MNKKVAFYTLGCKLNFSETTTISEQFLKRGFEVVDYSDSADVYVVNTCSVTENAERECRQIVRRALRTNPDAYVIVTGCYAQLRPEEIAKIEGVSAVLGSNEKFNLFNYINDFEISSKSGTVSREERKNLSCIYVTPTEELNSFYSSFSSEANDRTRAFFKVQDGCDYKCSFCTIPLARGKSRSAKPEEIVNEFKQLLNSNYKEIILTGVNVGDYGKSFGYNLYSLLNDLLKIDGDYRIRISSIEPNLLNDDLIDLIASTNKICNHLHIPLQSGSNKILRLMQRRYKTEDYHNLIYKAVAKIKELAVGVDVIVGFPGETNEDFLETYNFLKDLPIAYLHVFTYSERPNTKAINLPGKVEIAERKKRNNMLRILSDKKRNEFYRSMIGTEQTVLFEAENHNGLMKGFSSNYIRIKIPYEEQLINQFINVKITGVDENIATAELSLKQVEL